MKFELKSYSFINRRGVIPLVELAACSFALNDIAFFNALSLLSRKFSKAIPGNAIKKIGSVTKMQLYRKEKKIDDQKHAMEKPRFLIHPF